jgi:hypothetical protein
MNKQQRNLFNFLVFCQLKNVTSSLSIVRNHIYSFVYEGFFFSIDASTLVLVQIDENHDTMDVIGPQTIATLATFLGVVPPCDVKPKIAHLKLVSSMNSVYGKFGAQQ